MKNILHIISSPRQEASASIKLGNNIIEKLLEKYPGSRVKTINVSEKNYPALDQTMIGAFKVPVTEQSPEQRNALRISNDAVAELADADIAIIGSPLYNFHIPSTLKAWLDLIVRPGLSFRYANGKSEGLLGDKKIYLALASNGVYSDGPMKPMDFAEPYLRHILGFIGLNDITTFRVEGGGISGIMETALEKGLASVAV
ncbi:FMN-dependent NADH-azoreductase [Pseudobacter ginsenosidimutans]|uniref:FMN dependent NADH:quinone oxidoreductase n=1 Tax=Pseudobacter ginsenosidimutans TaxID=661488 RepID=A0A4Q7MQA5_9BACT|nr:NAD(P)H-dependent oxidoreductase [Pseudobacter ginsenosidimutans]QEC42443.1 FMN-dependent NADH-azoreductase [Pseudobacter ginsenosidimutans]RZS70707.1 FMN-dependent NADH-azoreductase [Pseudobacter ginsenosidimutans]